LTVNYEQAGVYLKKSPEVNSENEEALHALAFCFDSLGKSEESILFYNEYINIYTYSFRAWNNRTFIYDRVESFEEAIDAFDYSILINESFVYAYFNKGNALVNL